MNTANIEAIFREYLNGKTDYAILINGPWGTGKTYFWKKNLMMISEELKFKPIYLSLNGIGKIEQLEQELLVRLIPFLGKKERKGIWVAYNFVLKLIDKTGNLSDLIRGVGLDAFNFTNYVICFDDIERCPTPIVEVLGFINNLVEHKGAKTVLLAHEKKINPQEEYNNTKEKVVGRVLNFHWPLKEALPELIEPYIDQDIYYQFLLKNKDEILGIFEEYNQRNLRTISFYLEILKKIFTTLSPAEKPKTIREIILFTVMIVIEFKEGNLNSNDAKNHKGIEDIAFLYHSDVRMRKLMEDTLGKPDEENTVIPKSYSEEFYNRYLINRSPEYYFYSSIYEYVLTGYLDVEKITKEIDGRHPYESAEEIAFHMLVTYKFRELENEEFRKMSETVFSSARDGKYGIYSYFQIASFFYLFAEKGMVEYSKKELEVAFLNGLTIAQSRKEINDRVFDTLFHFNQTGTTATSITDRIKEIHTEIKREQIAQMGNLFIECVTNNDQEAVTRFFKENQHSSEWLQYINYSILFSAIVYAKNTMIGSFKEHLRYRYSVSNIGEFLYEDLECLKFLMNNLNQTLQDRTDFGEPKTFLLKELAAELQEVCRHLENTKKK